MATYSLSGTGTQTLTTGTGALYVTIATLPSGSGNGGANPADYYGIGLIRPGNATAFWEPFPVIGGPQWMPVPAGTTRIGYALFDGAAISVAEVSGSSPLAFPLASLPDVALASPSDAQVLAYQASTSKWINATPTGGGGGGTSPTLLLDYTETATLANGYNIATGSWTDVPGTSKTFTTTAAARVSVQYSGAYYAAPIGGPSRGEILIRLNVDGTTLRVITGGSSITTGSLLWNILAGAPMLFLSGLSIGSHTVKLQAQAVEATMTLYMQAGSFLRDAMNIQVVQY